MFEIIETDRDPELELSYTGEKILNGKQAWEVTFKKWEMLQDACMDGKINADGGVNTCGRPCRAWQRLPNRMIRPP